MADCTIVGAGISGLLAAKVLSNEGLEVVVLEKSRGVGGRMSTRRNGEAIFDHGAQFFTVRDSRFEHWVDHWIEAGLVHPWYDLPLSGTHYRATPSMTGIAKHLAESLDVRREIQISGAYYSHREKTWTLSTADRQDFESRSVILTAPVPQTLAILEKGEVFIPQPQREQLQAISYHRCIVAMAILDRPAPITANNGALKLEGEPIQWIADNQRKGVSPNAPALTIHSTPAFAEAHWDTPNSARISLLLEAATPHLGDAKVESSDGHRWGYSQPTASFEKEAYIDDDLQLAIAGDGLAGGRVEGAAISGLAAAAKILETLQK